MYMYTCVVTWNTSGSCESALSPVAMHTAHGLESMIRMACCVIFNDRKNLLLRIRRCKILLPYTFVFAFNGFHQITGGSLDSPPVLKHVLDIEML